MADDDMVMIRGASGTSAATVLLRGANDYMLDEMDRSLHDAFCVVKRVLESGKVLPGACSAPHFFLFSYLFLSILRSSFHARAWDLPGTTEMCATPRSS